MQKNCLSLNSFVGFIRLLSILILRIINKGAQLYKNAFCEADHRTLSELVKQCHRKWIVTYDICPLVAELYKPYRSSYLDVTYSIQSSKKAQEYIFFFSNNLVLPDAIDLRPKE